MGKRSAFSGSTTASTNPVHLGKVVYTGNFADPSQGWPTGSDDNKSLSVNGSNYTVQLKKPGAAAPAPNFNGVALTDLVDVAVSTTFQMSSAGVGDGVGVFCRAIQGHSYVFSVGPSSTSGRLSWSISRLNSKGASVQLGSGTTAAQDQLLAVEGDCVGGHGDNPVLLVLSLSGQVIGQASDTQIPAPFFGLSGLGVSSANGSTSATFSAFQVRAAT